MSILSKVTSWLSGWPEAEDTKSKEKSETKQEEKYEIGRKKKSSRTNIKGLNPKKKKKGNKK